MPRSLNRRALLSASLLAPLALGRAPMRSVAQEEDVQALVSRAAARMLELNSFHFEIETVDGRSTVFENLEVNRVVGDVLRPDSFRATITAKVAVVELDVDVISIGGAVWVTNPLEGGWQQVAAAGDAQAESVTALINPDQIFLKAFELVEEPTIEGTERIGEVETTVVSGMFTPTRLAELATPEADAEGSGEEVGAESLLATEPVYLTAWIDGEGRVLMIEEEGPLTESESDDVIRVIEFSAFDEPVEINPPDAGTD